MGTLGCYVNIILFVCVPPRSNAYKVLRLVVAKGGARSESHDPLGNTWVLCLVVAREEPVARVLIPFQPHRVKRPRSGKRGALSECLDPLRASLNNACCMLKCFVQVLI